MVKMYYKNNSKVIIDVEENRVENMKKRGYLLEPIKQEQSSKAKKPADTTNKT